jgi:hypothetical protein
MVKFSQGTRQVYTADLEAATCGECGTPSELDICGQGVGQAADTAKGEEVMTSKPLDMWDRVRHAVMGDGTVTARESEHTDNVWVRFDRGGEGLMVQGFRLSRLTPNVLAYDNRAVRERAEAETEHQIVVQEIEDFAEVMSNLKREMAEARRQAEREITDLNAESLARYAAVSLPADITRRLAQLEAALVYLTSVLEARIVRLEARP